MARTFFQRFSHHGMCVLPAEVLSDDVLVDPDTHEALPSLRAQASAQGLCYARVLRICGDGDGLYWAEVAATPQLGSAERVVLTEEDLYSALPYDVRVQGKSPTHIHKMLAAHACEVRPVQRVEPATPFELAPAPVFPLEPLVTVEVSADELHEALSTIEPPAQDDQAVCNPTGSFVMQQAFLRALIDVLMRALYQGQNRITALYLKAQCAAIALLQRWHRQRQSSQRVVNVVAGWSQERKSVVWRLTVGVPAPAGLAA